MVACVSEQQYSSMGLLSSLLYDPLNYGYSYTGGPLKPSTLYQKVLVFILAAVIAFGTTVAIRSLLGSRAEKEDTYAGLLAQVRAERDLNQQLLREVSELESQLKDATGGTVSVGELPDDLLAASHLASVRGAGVTVTVQSGAKSATGGAKDDPDANVQDQDLRVILNELWRSQAEGISINGIRIGPRTPVRTAGSSVLVNYHPVQQPYVITAVGPPGALERGMTTGVTGDYFSQLYQDYGISLVVAKEDALVLPAMKVPQINLQSIKVIEEGN